MRTLARCGTIAEGALGPVTIALDADTFMSFPERPPRGSDAEGHTARVEAQAHRVALVIGEYLERSFPLPISLSMRGYGRCRPHAERVFQLLAAHSRRWRDVELRLRCDTFVSAQALGSIEGSLPLLEKLYVHCSHNPMDESPIDMQIFSDCPKLNTLATPASAALPTLPLHQITRLYTETGPYYSGNGIERVLGLVHSLPQLSHMVVKCHAGYEHSDLDSESEFGAHPAEKAVIPAYQSDIRALILSSIRHTSKDPELHDLSRLCDGLTLPLLQECILQTLDHRQGRTPTSVFDHNPWEPASPLGTVPSNLPSRPTAVTDEQGGVIYTAYDDSCIWPQRAFMSLLQRSSCPLETLVIRDFVIEDTELIVILHLIPTLTTLKICEPLVQSGDHANHRIITKRFLQSLSYSSGQITLSPRLSHIDFVVCSYADLKTDLFEMFDSRWPSTSMDSAWGPVDEIAPLQFFQLQTRDGLTQVRASHVGGLRVVK